MPWSGPPRRGTGNDKQRNEILMKYLSARPFFAGISPPTPQVPKKKSAGSSEVKESSLENREKEEEERLLCYSPGVRIIAM